MSEGLESDSGVGSKFESKGFRVDTVDPENGPWDG